MYKKIIWLMFGKWVSSITSIIALFYFMGVAGPEQYGFFVIGCFMIVFGDLFFSEAVENYILKKLDCSSISYRNASKFSIGLCFKFAMPLGLIVAFLFYFLYSEDEIYELAIYVLPILFFQSLFYASKGFLIKADKDTSVAAIQSISGILALIVSITFNNYFSNINPFFFHQFCLFLFLSFSSVVFAFVFKNLVSSKINAHEKHYVTFQLKNVLLNIFTNRLDTLFVGFFLDVYNAGVYSFFKRIIQVVQEFFGGTFDKVFLALTSNDNRLDIKNKTLYLQAFLVFPIYIMLMIAGADAISIIYNDLNWLSFYNVLFILGLGGVFRTLISIERADKLKKTSYSQILNVRYIELLITLVGYLLFIILEQFSLMLIATIFLMKNTISYLLTANDKNIVAIDFVYLKIILIKLSPIFISTFFCALTLYLLMTFMIASNLLILLSFLIISALSYLAISIILLRRI